MRSFAIVIRREHFEAKKRRKYAKNVEVNRSVFAKVISRQQKSLLGKFCLRKEINILLTGTHIK